MNARERLIKELEQSARRAQQVGLLDSLRAAHVCCSMRDLPFEFCIL